MLQQFFSLKSRGFKSKLNSAYKQEGGEGQLDLLVWTEIDCKVT